jgi:hypothetical protein
MVISKSTKNEGKWIARAFCFSGRPDPTWVVQKNVIEQLEMIWNSLEPQSVRSSISPPILGYRGCSLTDNINHEWSVYDGHVTLKVNGKSDSRLDRNETFEKVLLSSSPPGTLPAFCFKCHHKHFN